MPATESVITPIEEALLLAEPSGRQPRVYFAAPLFSQRERRWNREVAQRLEAELGCTVALPQNIAVGDGLGEQEEFAAIFGQCLEGVRDADVVVAVLDGPDADSGAAFEMGYAYALGKPVVGLRTDIRKHQERGTNVMLSRCCAAFVRLSGINDDVGEVVRELAEALRAVLGGPEPPRGPPGAGGIPDGSPAACRDARHNEPSA